MVSYSISAFIAITTGLLIPTAVLGFSFSFKSIVKPKFLKEDKKNTTIQTKKKQTKIQKFLEKDQEMSVEFLDVPRMDKVKEDQMDTLLQELKPGKQLMAETNSLVDVTTKNEPGFFQKLTRQIQVYWLFFHMFLDYKFCQRKETKLRKKMGIAEEEDSDDYPVLVKLWNALHERNAQRLLKGIRSLEGFWVKVGQFLSSRADIMPPEYLRILREVQDSMPSKDFSDIQQTISEQLSKEERSLIQHIDSKPLATASIAQVHRATLRNGNEVVIKVQHRGVSTLMLQDMENLRILLALLNKFEPDADYSPMAREYTAEVKKELDFRIEAQNMDDVREVLDEHNVRVIIPKTVPNLVKEKVIVMDFCKGFAVRDANLFDEHKVDRKVFLDRVCNAWAIQMHVSGIFNADPHMGNILVSTVPQEDGDTSIPILLDFGLTKRFEPYMKIAFARLMHALDETDVDSLLQSFEEMGMKFNRHDPFGDMSALQNSFKDPVPQSQAKVVAKKKKKEYQEKVEAMREDEGLQKGQKLRNPVDAWPQELIMYGRVTNMLRGLCTALEVEYPYLKTMAMAARKTLNDEIPASEKVIEVGNEVKPSFINKRLEKKVLQYLETQKNPNKKLGLQLCVFKKGEEVINISSGVLGIINPRPVNAQSLFCIFSVSKSVLAMGILRLVQEKKIALDEPISKYWPKFGVNGKENITIRHALSHQSGLAGVLPQKVTLDTLLDWSHMKEVIEKSSPTHTPGEDTVYHALSFAWICGGIIESVTGLPYEEFLHDEIMEPLKMQNMLYMSGLPKNINVDKDVATLSFYDDSKEISNSEIKKEKSEIQRHPSNNKSPSDASKDKNKKNELAKYQGAKQLMNPLVFNMKQVRESKLPSANGYCSAFGLASLYAKFIDTKSEEFLVSEALLKETRSKHIPAKKETDFSDEKLLSDSMASFGLGFQLHEVLLSNGKVVNSIGHAGVGGTIVFAIPDIGLSVAFTTNMLTMKETVKKDLLKMILEEYDLRPPPTGRGLFA